MSTASLATRRDSGVGNPRPAPVRRLSSSVQLPWFVGVLALVVLALASILLVGRDRDTNLASHGALVTTQERLSAQAEGIRRSGNEDVDDLAVAAHYISAGQLPAQRALEVTAAAQPRWETLALLSQAGAVQARVGNVSAPMRTAAKEDERYVVSGDRLHPRVIASTPVVVDGQTLTLVGQASPEVLLGALDIADVEGTWMLDDGGAVVAATTSDPAPVLKAISRQQTTVEVYVGPGRRPVVEANAPINGDGPAGNAGYRLVTKREVVPSSDFGAFQLPGRVYGVSLLLLTALLAWGLRIAVIGPVLSLERQSERVAFGDLRDPVRVGTYDEVGRSARALERLRVALIRRRALVRDADSTDELEATGGDGQ